MTSCLKVNITWRKNAAKLAGATSIMGFLVSMLICEMARSQAAYATEF